MSINFYDQQDSSPHIYTNNDNSISPDRLHGLVLWIDGQCSTRLGDDKKFTAMQDIIFPFINGQGSNGGYTELAIQGNIWDGDFLELNTYAQYPHTGQSNVLTVESVFKVTKELDGPRTVLGCHYGAGWYFAVSAGRHPYFRAYDSDANAYAQAYNPELTLEIGKAYYAIMTYSSSGEITLEVKELGDKVTATMGAYKKLSTSYPTTMGTQTSTTNSANGELWDGLAVAMGRVWYRVLTDEEIEANYQDCKKRFNL